ncbi:putative S-adenosylmethionine-dependent methyltransferase [Morus notabilis]|uniref:Putative S-adenosylmethionine-dependent methyltransferase n=2 Tax=Morus notabilis TaxID=981085 RepID=W9QP11_9ROSA|nr:putative S-adenosylmethionine-dependent methyltransferase [Morus notabilis]
MEEEERGKLSLAYPMNSGDGPYSYANTSVSQRVVIDFTKELVQKEVAEKLDIGFSSTSPPKAFSIADLGCSVGPNTFSAVENIIEAVELKFESEGLASKIPEFQVFFNDHTSNDFNMLFKNIPPIRRYYAAGVPGSFYSRIFPEASLHFVHSSFSIHWLSQVPKEVIDKSSPAWNKGRVYYSNSPDEVIKAYKAQYEKDMEELLQARAQEVVCGGLMVFIILGIANGVNPFEAGGNRGFDLIGSCLMDMVKKGIVSEEKVDSFNIPTYLMTPQEFEAAVKRNGSFSAERIEVLPHVKVNGASLNAHQLTYCVRSTLGQLIKQEFGEEIVDELFDLYLKKLEEIDPSSIAEAEKTISFLAVLKRKPSQ